MRKLMFLLLTLLPLTFISCSDDDVKTYNPEDYDLYHMVVAMGLQVTQDTEYRISFSGGFPLSGEYKRVSFSYIFHKTHSDDHNRQELHITVTKTDNSTYFCAIEDCKKTNQGYTFDSSLNTDTNVKTWLKGYFNGWDDFRFYGGDPEIDISQDNI